MLEAVACGYMVYVRMYGSRRQFTSSYVNVSALTHLRFVLNKTLENAQERIRGEFDVRWVTKFRVTIELVEVNCGEFDVNVKVKTEVNEDTFEVNLRISSRGRLTFEVI